MLVILKTGSTLPDLIAARGDFERWFLDAMEVDRPVSVLSAPAGDPLPDPADVTAVVVTGSSAMVTDRAPWSVAAGQWLADLTGRETPMLCVCYGHQLLADALGGEVGRNPRGREIGTIDVELTPAASRDPLFSALPPVLTVQATHLESVLRLPPGAELLGGNALDPHQAYRVGERAWAVQFHPEMDAGIIRLYIRGRAERCRAEGIDPEATILATREAGHGRALLRRFASLL